jgi:hypothetical protein
MRSGWNCYQLVRILPQWTNAVSLLVDIKLVSVQPSLRCSTGISPQAKPLPPTYCRFTRDLEATPTQMAFRFTGSAVCLQRQLLSACFDDVSDWTGPVGYIAEPVQECGVAFIWQTSTSDSNNTSENRWCINNPMQCSRCETWVCISTLEIMMISHVAAIVRACFAVLLQTQLRALVICQVDYCNSVLVGFTRTQPVERCRGGSSFGWAYRCLHSSAPMYLANSLNLRTAAEGNTCLRYAAAVCAGDPSFDSGWSDIRRFSPCLEFVIVSDAICTVARYISSSA